MLSLEQQIKMVSITFANTFPLKPDIGRLTFQYNTSDCSSRLRGFEIIKPGDCRTSDCLWLLMSQGPQTSQMFHVELLSCIDKFEFPALTNLIRKWAKYTFSKNHTHNLE